MNQIDLLSTTVELALDLLEKNGLIVPFCRAISSDGEIILYSPETHVGDTNFKKAEEHQRNVVLQEIMIRKLVGLAFCKVVELTMKEPDEIASAIKVEYHQSETTSKTYYFLYQIENGIAAISTCYTLDAEPIELWIEP